MHQNPKLTEEQKRILFNKGTEAPGTGALLHNDKNGEYHCANCGSLLFMSDHKYTTTTPGLVGWPSFADAANNKAVKLVPDDSLGMARTEVICANCGGHLGHVFDDAESSTGVHYCINSACLAFNESK